MISKLQEKLAYLTRLEIISLMILDSILLPLALFTAVWLRLGGEWDHRLNNYLWIFFSVPLWTIPIFINLGLYRAIVKYLDETIVYIVFMGVCLSVMILTILIYFNSALAFPRTAIIIYWLFSLTYIGSSRIFLRGIIRKIDNEPGAEAIAIYGAGIAGVQLENALNHSGKYNTVAFFDDDPSKWRTIIRGTRVHSPANLIHITKKFGFNTVLLAIPSISLSRRREIIQKLEQNSIYVKTLPGIQDLISGEIKFSDVKDVEIEDLLGRSTVPARKELLTKNIIGKNVLITGAGGSIGSELARQIARLNPAKLIIFDSCEFALYSIEQELRLTHPHLDLITILGNITKDELVNNTLTRYKVDTIYHAAAYKHVPMVEFNPLSGIENNIIGTLVVAKNALKNNVANMVLISTDKAVRPTNIMGASKRLAELILQAMAQVADKTVFNMVRFGNVLGSSGSVVPLFKKQILSGGPVTVTHPDIIRYFMTIPEAVELVLQASNMALGGEVFVLDMGEPVKIVELAKKMIYLSGFTLKDLNNPNGDIEIKFNGLRPGEKLYEELLIGNSPELTNHSRIMKANEHALNYEQLMQYMDKLIIAVNNNDEQYAINLLKEVVTEYNGSY